MDVFFFSRQKCELMNLQFLDSTNFAGMTKLGFMFKDRVGMCQLKKYPFGTKTESEGWRIIS